MIGRFLNWLARVTFVGGRAEQRELGWLPGGEKVSLRYLQSGQLRRGWLYVDERRMDYDSATLAIVDDLTGMLLAGASPPREMKLESDGRLLLVASRVTESLHSDVYEAWRLHVNLATGVITSSSRRERWD